MGRRRYRKPSDKTVIVFVSGVTGGLVVERRVKRDQAEAMVADGTMDRVIVDGVALGYRRNAHKTVIPVDSQRSAAAITARESAINAGSSFSQGKSKTSTMSEAERAARVHPLTRRRLPEEDAVERVVAKVAAFAKPVEGTTADKATTIYPSGIVAGQYRRTDR